MRYDVAIHHKDFNKLNNNPSNLQVQTAYEHWKWHSENLSLRWKEDPKFKDKIFEAFKSENFSEKMKHRYDNEPIEKREERLIKLTLNNKGKHFGKQSEETCKKKSEKKKGVPLPHTPEWNSNLSIARKEMYKNFTEEQWEHKRQVAKEIFSTPNAYENRVQGINDYWNSMSDEEKELKSKQMSENYNKSRDKVLISKWKTKINKMLSQGIEITLDNFIAQYNGNDGRQNVLKYLNDRFDGDFDKFLYLAGLKDSYNHKITKVEFIHLPMTPVYDMSIEKYHNFATEAGVILHNCEDFLYRFGYWCSKTDIITGEKQNIPSNITNPHNKLGSGCKHLMLVLANTGWLIKVASVLNNYIHYMEKHREQQYAKFIYPAIYGKKYEEPVQTNIFGDDEVETDTEFIDVSNEEGRTRGRFSSTNQPARNPSIRKARGEEEIEVKEEED